MRIKQSYDEDFSGFILDMKDKYPKSIFELNGISDSTLDQTKFAKNYFTKKNVADITPDANANVQIKNVATFNEERHKGLDKLNSFFVFWKTAKKLYGLREANRLAEKEFCKDLNIQDSSNFYMAYSYYSQTPILLKIDGVEVYWTMRQLYDSFSEFGNYIFEKDMYKISVSDIKPKFDYSASFLVGESAKRFDGSIKPSFCPYVGAVVKQTIIEIWDSENGWVKLEQIIKHKHEDDKRFVIYQTNNGDFSFVTEDHPVILEDGTEKNAIDLQENDSILKNETLPEFKELVDVPKDVAYLTGFILGDGNCDGYDKNYEYIKRKILGKETPNLRFCRGGNTILVYQKDIHNDPIKDKIKKTFKDVKFYNFYKEKSINSVGFTSKAYSLLYGDFFNCGYKTNSFSKRLPENIMFWKTESINALLGGLIDSDGTINKGTVVLRLASYAIINQLYDVLRSRGYNVDKNVYFADNKLGNNFIFGIRFKVVRDLIDFSDKMKKVDEKYFDSTYSDRIIRNNKIKYKYVFTKKDISKHSFLNQEIENVYDVTTESGRFYSNGMVQHNCFNFDTYDVLTTGLPFVTNFPSEPPKHSDTFWQHVTQILQHASSQLMGATGIANFIIIYSALLKYDSEDKNYPVPDYKENKKLFERYVKQRLQELIYTLNQPLRKVQSVFTNITIYDKFFMKEVCSYYLVKDKTINVDFALYIQKMFLEVLNKINETQLATFPVLSVQFKKDENGTIEDDEFLDLISEINLPVGHLNILSDENITVQSSCCRLCSNVEDLMKISKEENMNLIGGSISKIGSFGVTSVPLVRMALKANKDETKFFELIEESVVDALKINHCRRYLINEKIEQNQMPLYTHGYMSLKNQYSTVGVNGFYEALYFMGYDILSDEGLDFGKKVLKLISDICQEKIKYYEYKINTEQIPAEQTASKLAKADKILYKQNEFEIYGNQFIPLTVESSMYDRIRLQAELEEYFSGGTILHINVSEKIPTKKIMKKVIQDVVKSGVKYFAINYFFNKCKEGHLTADTGEVCKICGSEIVEKYTRIVGFLVPYSSFSEDRRKEFDQRKKYKIE